MAKKIFTNINLRKLGQLINSIFHLQTTSEITSNLTAEGQFAYDTDIKRLKIFDGTDPRYLLQDNDIVELGGQLAQFTWKHSTITTASDPSNGFFRFNNSTISSVTQLYVDDITSANQVDISDLFGAVQGDWLIHVQQRNDADKWVQFSTSGTYTDNTGWWTLPVTYLQSGIGGAIANGIECMFIFINKNGIPNTTSININGKTALINTNPEFRTAQASTGALTYAGLSIASSTTVDIGACTGYIIDNETNPNSPTFTRIDYLGETGKTVTTIASGIITYVLLQSNGSGGGTIVFQNTFPTSAQRKTMIYLSKISHPNSSSLSFAANEVDFMNSPVSQFRDLFQSFNYINKDVYPSSNGANLNFNISTGTITGNGINFVTDKTNPNTYIVAAQTPASFIYRNQNGGTSGFITTIDPTNYDNGGTTTAVGGGANSSTLQHIFYVPPLGLIVQRGQTVYSSLTAAIAAIGKESFVLFPNLSRNSILIGVLAVTKGATALNNTTQAQFFKADILGQIIGSSAGVSTGTVQSAYNNSTQPIILTDSTRGAFRVQRGSAADTDNIYEGQNGAGSTTWQVDGNGKVTSSSFWNASGEVGIYWKTVQGTPVRVGNTSFTITDTSNANLYDKVYGRTTVLKWTDTGVTKMAMVVNTSYSTNTVTVTIMGDILASTATMSSMTYSREKSKPIIMAIAGTLATGTDLTGKYYAPCALKIFGADGYHGTAGTTNATTYDINLNGTTFMTTKLSIASAATSGLGFTADNGTETASPNTASQIITVDCDSVSTTAPVDAYIYLYTFPLNSQYL